MRRPPFAIAILCALTLTGCRSDAEKFAETREFLRQFLRHQTEESVSLPLAARLGSVPVRTPATGEPKVDGWGEVYWLYCPGPIHKDGWDLVSFGRNGIYEEGRGDDLSVGDDVVGGIAAIWKSTRDSDMRQEFRETLHNLSVALLQVARQGEQLPLAARFPRTQGLDNAEGHQEKLAELFRGADFLEIGDWPTRKALERLDDGVRILDPWGNPVYYRCPGPIHKRGFDLISCGPNGVYEQGRGDDVVDGQDLPGGLAPVTSTATTTNQTLCWRVTSEDGGEVHLLGSIHAATEDFYPLPREILEPFNKAKFLAVESDVEKLETIEAVVREVNRIIAEKSKYGAGDGLSQHVSRECVVALKEAVLKWGLLIGVEQFEQTRPWAHSETLGKIAVRGSELEYEKGIDRHFIRMAKKEKKEVLEMESAKWYLERKFEILAGFSDEVQEKALLASIKELSKANEQLWMLAQAWRDGDAERLEELLTEERLRDDSIRKGYWEFLLDERNAAMTKKIQGYLTTKDRHFVVVGCAHLFGKKGLLALLEAKNYKIERIKKSTEEPPNGTKGDEKVNTPAAAGAK